MSRYIDADAYAAELWKLRGNYQMLDDTHTADKIMHGIFRAEQALKEQPTVDAVQVVRCKDCIYAERARVNDKGFTICEASNMEITENDFCSYGERKDDERKDDEQIH